MLGFAVLSTILLYVSGSGQSLPLPAPSGSEGSSSWTGETSFEEQVLLEPFPETDTAVNQPEARPVLPANQVASPGEGAGSYSRAMPDAGGISGALQSPPSDAPSPVPSTFTGDSWIERAYGEDNSAAPGGGGGAGPSRPFEPYPYGLEEVIGGDSVSAIQSRFLRDKPSSAPVDTTLAQYNAEDLFEVKVEIIKVMAGLDPTGDWMGWGARALDNPRTATGEPSLDRLNALFKDLNDGGVQSETFADLKSRMIRER